MENISARTEKALEVRKTFALMTQVKLEQKLNACEAKKKKADDIADKLNAMQTEASYIDD